MFIEHIELQPIDPQTNDPQLFYGLRYHTHIVKPGETETCHDQVGYEPVPRTRVQDGRISHPGDDHPDDTWAYEEAPTVVVEGQAETFHHTDRNVLTRISAPTANRSCAVEHAAPLAAEAARGCGSLS